MAGRQFNNIILGMAGIHEGLGTQVHSMGMEGLAVAGTIMLLPLIVLFVLIKVLPPWPADEAAPEPDGTGPTGPLLAGPMGRRTLG